MVSAALEPHPTIITVQQLIRIAVFQAQASSGDIAFHLDRLEQQARSAAADGAGIVVFPELMLSGYHLGREGLAKAAVEVAHSQADAVGRIAKRHNIAIAAGYPEHAAEGVYNSALFVSADGTPLLNYRKSHLYGARERECFVAADDDVRIVEYLGWRIGMLICYDIEFPETARALGLAGADLVLAPTALTTTYGCVADTLIAARAIENQIYVAYANYCGPEKELVYYGASRIAAPTGETVAAADDSEALIMGDIDVETLRESRRLNTYLADRRPSLYRAWSESER